MFLFGLRSTVVVDHALRDELESWLQPSDTQLRVRASLGSGVTLESLPTEKAAPCTSEEWSRCK